MIHFEIDCVKFCFFAEEEDFNGMEESEIIDLACQSKLEQSVLESVMNNVKSLF